MEAVYQGCLQIVQCLEREGTLAPEWTAGEAADFMWAALAITTWEDLIERGWSKDQYVEHTAQVLKRALVRER